MVNFLDELLEDISPLTFEGLKKKIQTCFCCHVNTIAFDSHFAYFLAFFLTPIKSWQPCYPSPKPRVRVSAMMMQDPKIFGKD